MAPSGPRWPPATTFRLIDLGGSVEGDDADVELVAGAAAPLVIVTVLGSLLWVSARIDISSAATTPIPPSQASTILPSRLTASSNSAWSCSSVSGLGSVVCIWHLRSL